MTVALWLWEKAERNIKGMANVNHDFMEIIAEMIADPGPSWEQVQVWAVRLQKIHVTLDGHIRDLEKIISMSKN
jgi:hypothetical protein